jgi:toxin ParE1/3/4
MAKYVLTNKAVLDLDDIWNYTIRTWSEEQADQYFNTLVDFFTTIAQNPNIGKSYPEVTQELFGSKVNHHVIFYRMISPNLIEIVRIVHERMDLKNRMKE